MLGHQKSLRFLFSLRGQYQTCIAEGHDQSILVPVNRTRTDGTQTGKNEWSPNIEERTTHRAHARPRERAVYGHHALPPIEGDIDLLQGPHAETVCSRFSRQLSVGFRVVGSRQLFRFRKVHFRQWFRDFQLLVNCSPLLIQFGAPGPLLDHRAVLS